MNQKELGELLIKTGEAILKDGQNHDQQAVALLDFMELHERTDSHNETAFRHLTEMRLYLKGYPDECGAISKIVSMMPREFAGKTIDEAWDLKYDAA